MQVVHKENFLSEIKVAVARPLPDEEALWRGDTQAIQGDVDDFGLANKRRDALEEGQPASMRASGVGRRPSVTGSPHGAPRPGTSRGLAFLSDQDHLAGPRSVPGTELCAGRTTGEQAGVAPAMVARLSRLRWYNVSGLPPRRPWLGQLDLPWVPVSHRRLPAKWLHLGQGLPLAWGGYHQLEARIYQ